ncbi:biopolymer transporter ExbD [Bdellovibrionota bacterium FG-1]
MFKKRGLFHRKSAGEQEMSLQITSLADIFVILLVFLLKGYATGVVSLSPSKGLLLPEAQASEANVDALKLEVSETSVSIEGQSVAGLAAFRFEASDLQTNGASTILSKALERARQHQLLIAKSNSDVKVDPKIIVIADQRTPYVTIKSVLASAAIQGYTDFKLAVIKGQ